MKKYLLIFMFIVFSCVPTSNEIHMDMTPKSALEMDANRYKRIILINEYLPKTHIIIPKYVPL